MWNLLVCLTEVQCGQTCGHHPFYPFDISRKGTHHHSLNFYGPNVRKSRMQQSWGTVERPHSLVKKMPLTDLIHSEPCTDDIARVLHVHRVSLIVEST